MQQRPELDLEKDVYERLRDDLFRVPPYPAVVARLQSVLADEKFGMREITAVVGADATLSATLLRLANSAALRGTLRVDSLESAVFKVGTHELVKLATASSVGAVACATGPLAWLRHEHWRSSLFGAVLSEELAMRRGVKPELAFMAGLLHGFGAVVVVACIEDIATHRTLPPLPESAWRKLVCLYQAEFGKVVATKWRLPDAIAEVISRHHFPEASQPVYRALVQLVVTVDQVLQVLDEHPSEGLDALARVRALTADDRQLIASLLPRLAAKMSSFETCMPEAWATGSSSVIVPERAPAAESWSVDFGITLKTSGERVRAACLSTEALELSSKASLTPGSLTYVTLECHATVPITLLMNVKSCEVKDGGEHLITLRPFGLSRAEKSAWLVLLTETRRASAEATDERHGTS
jgi:HD-like signal output (HDOD) protein